MPAGAKALVWDAMTMMRDDETGLRVPPAPGPDAAAIAAAADAPGVRGALAVVGPGDRVLQAGTVDGVLAARLMREARPATLCVQEPDAARGARAAALFRANGLADRIDLRREATPLAHLIAEARPDVLILDRPGEEAALLAGTDLSGLRAVVVTFHPQITGQPAMKRAKDALRAQGFAKRRDVSTRLVWTAERGAAAEAPPDPEGGWSTVLRTVAAARVYPPKARSFTTPAGVRDGAGRYVPEAALWRNRRLLTPPPPEDAPEAHLSGRWLWGGVLMRSFSHFVAETPARLWALDHLDEAALAGVLFIDRRGKDAPLGRFHDEFFRLMGLRVPVRLAAVAMEVETLVVPGQGFGLGAITAGTPAFRAAMRRRFARDVTAEGPERLYISRSGLGPGRGGLIGEERLEARLAAEGYEIFHPERHDLTTQIARYKAARQVVAAEGSALHLFAFHARPEQQVAVIVRRRSGATDRIAAHIAAFAGRPPHLIEALARVWRHRKSDRPRLDLGELDLPAVGAALRAAGVVTDAAPWPALDPAEIPHSVTATHRPR